MAKTTDINTGEEFTTVALSDPHGRVTDPVVTVPKERTEPLVDEGQYEGVSDAEKVRRAAEKLQAEKAAIPAQDKRTERIRKGETDTGFPEDYTDKLKKASKELQKDSADDRTLEQPDDYAERVEKASRELQKQAIEQDETDTPTEKATKRQAETSEKAVRPEPKAR